MILRTNRCIAPNPALDQSIANNKLITEELHDDRNAGIYSKSTSNFILLLVTQLSYITRSCIKEALTILLRRPPTFHLKESVERRVTSSSQHCTHQVQYGRRWIRINPFNPTAHTPKMLSYFLRSSKFLNASKLLIT